MEDRVEESASGLSYATWQDRQLAAILARTAELLRAMQASHAVVERNEELARELGKAAALLEIREGESRRFQEDARFWRTRADALDRQLEQQIVTANEQRIRSQQLQDVEKELRAAQQRLQNEVARLTAIEANYAIETQNLSTRANGLATESANLRRLTNELQSSLSWKITAPLRFLTKPFFLWGRRSPPAGAPPAPPETARPEIAISPSVPAAAPPSPAEQLAKLVETILPELRRARSIAIIPCAIPFSSTLNQRPISCARYLADRGTTVLYVAWQWQIDEPVPQAGEEVYPRVYHVPLYAFLNHAESIAQASYAKSIYFCTLPSAPLVDVMRPLRAAGYHIHYDIMDDWEGFHRGGEAPWFSAPVEHEAVILSDTVSAVSDKLIEKFAHLRSDIALVRNGYRPGAMGCEQFLAARTPLEGHKVIGYFGHFSDAWFDWDTVIHAARSLPDVEFELIGWAVSDATQKRLNGIRNIRQVGIVPQKDLHRYARKWWAGMIPFQATQVSAAVDPLKIYEYLHLGLPSIVTGIGGIAGFPLVHFVEGGEKFVEAVRGIVERPDERLLSEVAEFLKECVWEERFAKMEAMIAEPAGLAALYGTETRGV